MAVSVAEVTAWGDFTAALVDSFEILSNELGEGASGRIEKAFLEPGDTGFRVLVVNEDDSAMMIGRGGVEWGREEALAAVDQVWKGTRTCLFFFLFDTLKIGSTNESIDWSPTACGTLISKPMVFSPNGPIDSQCLYRVVLYSSTYQWSTLSTDQSHRCPVPPSGRVEIVYKPAVHAPNGPVYSIPNAPVRLYL